jgi:hypothetical protein
VAEVVVAEGVIEVKTRVVVGAVDVIGVVVIVRVVAVGT